MPVLPDVLLPAKYTSPSVDRKPEGSQEIDALADQMGARIRVVHRIRRTVQHPRIVAQPQRKQILQINVHLSTPGCLGTVQRHQYLLGAVVPYRQLLQYVP